MNPQVPRYQYASSVAVDVAPYTTILILIVYEMEQISVS